MNYSDFLTEVQTLDLVDLRKQCIRLVEVSPSENPLEMEFVDDFLQFSSTADIEEEVRVVDL